MPLRSPIGPLCVLVAACSASSSGGEGPSDAGSQSAETASPSDAAGQPDAAGILVACNDGTGLLDCCSSAVVESASCSAEGVECWTQCSQGLRGHHVCSGGTWLAGHGLFPCGDGGTITDAATFDASDAAPADASAGSEAGSPCASAGGTVGTALCCGATGDFPNMCAIGACGCSPTSSHMVQVCNCPAGKCFDGTTCR